MLTGKKIILFGAGIIGRRALNFFGPERVSYFTDNHKAGQTFWGKPVISFAELKEICNYYDVVISTGVGSTADIEGQCGRNGVRYFLFHELVSHEDYESNPAIRQFKNNHRGERCFLIGNGPSLRAEDLTTLYEHKEITFGCNAISKIYEFTPWRPKYYMVADPVFFLDKEMLANTEADYKFIPEISDVYANDETEIKKFFDQKGGRIIYCREIKFTSQTQEPPFSSDVSKAAYGCGTVLYQMIQYAAYMGFTRIYLLGVDGTSASPTDVDDYFSEKRHFYSENENTIRQMGSYAIIVDTKGVADRVANAYKKAEKVTRQYGMEIINATRGGKIETFKRIDFDSLFKKE